MKRFLLFALAVIVFAACSKDAINEQQNMQTIVDEAPETITVGFEGDDTRIQLNEAQKTVWTKGDLVSVFYKSDANQKYEYRGETGERTAELHKVSAGSSTTKMGYVVVAYPYNEEYIISPASGNLETMLPAVQHYAVDSYGVGDNLMVSCSEFTQFSLKSVCGWLKLQLTGNGEKVKSITLRGNNGEQVAGLIHVDTKSAEATLYSEEVAPDDNGNANGSLVIDGAMATEVMLYCDEGVTLSSEATAFYIALPPQTFENGLTVDVNCKGYNPMSITTQKVVAIERNHIQPMAEVAFSSDVRTIANNEIWYTAKEKIEDAQWTYDTFGANIASHEWDSTTGEGIISFDDDIAIIGDNAFYENENLTSVTFNNSLKNIGQSAFQGCSSLTEVAIPGNIEEVGYWSFADCLNLTQINIEKGDGQLSAFYAFDNVSANLYVDRDLKGEFLNYPFSDAKLTSITIGPNMKHIEECVFGYCEELQSLNFDQNSQIEKIGRYAFVASHIPGVVHIPASVVEIDPSAFALTTGITYFSSSSQYYEVGSFYELRCDSTLFRCTGTVAQMWISSSTYDNIGDWSCCGSNIEKVLIINNPGAIKIGDYAFWKCPKLAVMEPYGAYMNISSIGDGVFGYTAIEALNFLDSTFTSINGTFRQCEALQSLYLPATLTDVGERSFEDCKNLTSLYIAATTPPTLSSDAFNVVADELKIYVPFESLSAYRTNWSEYSDRFVGYDFENGVVVDIPNNEIWYTATDKVTPYNSDVFNVTIQSHEWNSTTGIGVITFDGDVTTIGGYAFYNCDSLTSVNIGDSVTTIGDSAFASCYGLTSVNIGDSVTTIVDYAFYNCLSLTSVNIPDSVTSIGDRAFQSCYSLTSVYCKATTPPALGGDYVFDDNGSGRKIYVPTESVDAYKSAAYWSEYADAIDAYDFENGVVVE